MNAQPEETIDEIREERDTLRDVCDRQAALIDKFMPVWKDHQRRKKIDINNIALGDFVTVADGREGKVTNICEIVWDGIQARVEDRIKARARFFIEFDTGGMMLHTHRRDGVSHCEAGGDIVAIRKAGT